MMNFAYVLMLLLPLFAPAYSFAQTTSVPDASEQAVHTAPVIIDDMTLFSVTGIKAAPAEERADVIVERIKKVAADKNIPVTSLTVVESEYSTDIMAGDRKLVSIYDVDAAADRVPRQILARAYLGKIKAAIDKYRLDRSPENLARGAGYSLLAVIGLIAALFLLRRLYLRLYATLESRYKSRVHALHIQSVEFVRVEKVWSAVTGTLRTIRLILVVIMCYICLHLVLGFFPWTRLFAAHMFGYVMKPVLMIGNGTLKYVPNLFFITVLLIFTRYFLKLLGLFFTGIEHKTLTIAGFEPDWARPTYKIVRLLVVVFALVVAYPYIPGSESPAFKGISVFLGVLFSLGSSSAVSNIIAGYMMTYRRAFRVGDRVKIDEFTGDVTQIKMQATHLRTVKNEEVIVPNSNILAGHVVNYSSLAKEHGLILHTSVTIGYDVPWRQVDGMLLLAAERTAGILREPRPFVLHKSLDDFFVNYELNVYTDKPQEMTRTYSQLHQNILDAFNEHGVQIMSPHYESDPAQMKIVPKEKWFEPPAEGTGAAENS
jgi:small-conductance mechanosensitive channel